MRFCTHCGSEVNEQAAVCVKCGCAIEKTQSNSGKQYLQQSDASASRTSVAIILGICGIVFAWIFALVGHITSIIGIVLGIKEYKETDRMTGLALSIIGEACSIFSSIIGAVAMSSIF